MREQYLELCFNCLEHHLTENIAYTACPKCGTPMRFFDSPNSLNILHADMDAFFASVEIHDNPTLKGKPVIVGGDPNSRSVVSACSYEARKFGIHSAMPSYLAHKKCPQAIFIRPNMKRYIQVSKQIFTIFHDFTPMVEGLSVDEAFLDMSGTHKLWGWPIIAAIKLKQRIKAQTGLNVSVGVAENKFLAKLASDENKPDGLFVITPSIRQNYLDSLPIKRMWGIGKASLPMLEKHKIHTIGDIRKSSDEKLRQIFKNQWMHFKRLSMGQDTRKVQVEYERKSCGKETTLANDTTDKDEMLKVLLNLTTTVASILAKSKLEGKTITLKFKTATFKLISRSKTLPHYIRSETKIYETIKKLVAQTDLGGNKIRLVGLNVSNFKHLEEKDKNQLELFSQTQHKDEEEAKQQNLTDAVEQIRQKFGARSINKASNLPQP